MMGAGFPLPGTNWYFSIIQKRNGYTIHIYDGKVLIVNVNGSDERIAKGRAWDALQEYCFRHSGGTK